MKGCGCFIVSLLNCLIPMLFPVSKGHGSQVRGRRRLAADSREGAAGGLARVSAQAATSRPGAAGQCRLLLR